MHRHGRILLTLLFILMLTAGCAPVINKATLETVDRTVRFSDLTTDPDRYIGKRVLLGGTIVGIENREKKTEIEVLEQPLNYQLKPTSPEESAGRFLAVFDSFKDPALYSKNRRVTVVGVFRGIETRKLGKMDYGYPVVDSVESYLWSVPYGDGTAVGVGLGVGFGF